MTQLTSPVFSTKADPKVVALNSIKRFLSRGSGKNWFTNLFFNQKEKKQKELYLLLLDLFRICGWLDSGAESLRSRRAVTSAHINAIAELIAFHDVAGKFGNLSGVGFKECIDAAEQYHWSCCDRLGPLCDRLKVVYKEYVAIRFLLDTHNTLRSLASRMRDLYRSNLSIQKRDDPLGRLIQDIPMPIEPSGINEREIELITKQIESIVTFIRKKEDEFYKRLRLNGLLSEDLNGNLME